MSELVKKIIKVLIIGVALAGIVFFMYNRKKEQPYQEGVVAKGDVHKTINVDATMNPDLYADITSELPTLISSISVSLNDKVEKGDELFKLDKKSISAQIANARLAVERAELAEKKSRRKWDLLKPEERTSIKKATQQSRETLRELYAQSSKTTVLSPIDGIIVEQNARVGEVAQGRIMRIIDPQSLQVEALIPEVDIAKVRPGNKAIIVFDAYPDKRIEGVFESMDRSSTVQNQNTYFKATINMRDKNSLAVLDGMNAEVDIEIAVKKNVVIVSREFAKKDKDGYFVYILNADQRGKDFFIKKRFEAGLVGDEFVEVMSGLTTKDKIVLPENLNQ
jgi:RND family efflux transporter MFP subunit